MAAGRRRGYVGRMNSDSTSHPKGDQEQATQHRRAVSPARQAASEKIAGNTPADGNASLQSRRDFDEAQRRKAVDFDDVVEKSGEDVPDNQEGKGP